MNSHPLTDSLPKRRDQIVRPSRRDQSALRNFDRETFREQPGRKLVLADERFAVARAGDAAAEVGNGYAFIDRLRLRLHARSLPPWAAWVQSSGTNCALAAWLGRLPQRLRFRSDQ
jgi:hypothetical protein